MHIVWLFLQFVPRINKHFRQIVMVRAEVVFVHTTVIFDDLQIK